jgi:hypothetical protein
MISEQRVRLKIVIVLNTILHLGMMHTDTV